jgi:hypothetical protein
MKAIVHQDVRATAWGIVGADLYEHTPARTAQRNGHPAEDRLDDRRGLDGEDPQATRGRSSPRCRRRVGASTWRLYVVVMEA